MKIIKTSQEPQAVLQPGHLEDINRLSRTPLTEAVCIQIKAGIFACRMLLLK